MSYTYSIHEAIDLYVEGRISKADARRQRATASVILQRLEVRPGIVLADEVGMGKTFVALAVAASVALSDRRKRPVVVMVPPSLKEKWPKDFRVFKEKCIRSESVKKYLTFKSADNAIEFFKLLDDAPYSRVSIIFLTHGAMNPYRKLRDRWVKLAILQKAIYKKPGAKGIRRAMCRFIGDLLRMKSLASQNGDVWEELLSNHPQKWLGILKNNHMVPADDDDPVPEAVIAAMENMDFSELYTVLKAQIPRRKTETIDYRLKIAREAINEKILELWDHCIRSIRFKLPLLVLDEAHHLKNPRTQFASLFQTQEAKDDADELRKGPLAEVFERMLFLTATPFQLGHYELCEVLDRISGISWRLPRGPNMEKSQFARDLKDIRSKLDAAQESAVRLDHLWGKLIPEDMVLDNQVVSNVDVWWAGVIEDKATSKIGQQLKERYQIVLNKMKEAERNLQPYLIRHSRPKSISEAKTDVPRRYRYAGKAILNNEISDLTPGLDILGDALLPFLLSARVTALRPDTRPIFAEGLASSYEAFLHTRDNRIESKSKGKVKTPTDTDDDMVIPVAEDNHTQWYLDQLENSLSSKILTKSYEIHPKVSATIKRSVELWKAGEKVLIFCHYLATGETLRSRLIHALDNEVSEIAYRKLQCTKEAAAVELERLGRRIFSEESPVRRGTDRATQTILSEFTLLESFSDPLKQIVRRYLRTPSFLVRFFPLKMGRLNEDDVIESLSKKDASGMSFEQLIKDFFYFLVHHCSEDERKRYIEALIQMQTGAIVRLANGNTRQEIRQRLMLTFNTPFYPEILVASMIMAEGVDLHLNCRHVIHHDLCWNPSTLEQRTGRIDRIGAKVERCKQPIQVYLPYIAKTQDEKMYRVVMDRERWFKVVMGERYKVDAKTTEKLAERIPFPEKAADKLAFDLSVFR